MATLITELPLVTDYTPDDLIILYDSIQEKTSIVNASKFRGTLTHVLMNLVATPPASLKADPMFVGRLLKLGDFWRDDTQTVDGSYRLYHLESATDTEYTWGAAELHVPRVPTVFHVVDQAHDWQPPTDPLDAFFGGVAPVVGDRLQWTVTGTTVGKQLITQTVNILGGVLNWGTASNPNPPVIHSSGILTHPQVNDLDFSVGDYMLGLEGNLYGPYVVASTTAELGWPVYSYRLPHQYTILVINYAAALALDVDDVQFASPIKMQGDTILVSIAGGSKQVEYTVGRVDPAEAVYLPPTGHGLVNFRNPNPTITHSFSTQVHPVRDDNIYSIGDYIAGVEGNTFGPYVAEESDDSDAWPIHSVRRPIQYTVVVDTDVDALALDINATDFDVPLKIPGDTVLVFFPSAKQYVYTIELVDGQEGPYQANSGYAFGTPVNPNTVLNVSLPAGRPSRDDDTYSTGDMGNTSDGMTFGPYVSGAATDLLGWPLQSLRDTLEHVIPAVADDAAIRTFDITTLTTLLIPNDTFLFSITGSTKQVRYTVAKVTGGDEDYAPADGFQLITRRNALPGRWFLEASTVQPLVGESIYSTGDMTVNGSGIIYGPYVEAQPSDILAWPLGPNIPAMTALGAPVVTQDVTGVRHTLKLDEDGNIYLEEL